MYIATTGEVDKLNVDGDAVEAWEKIVEQNNKANGVTEYNQYLAVSKRLALTLNDYTVIKAALTKLSFTVDRSLIAYLNKKGYKIDVSSNQGYIDSLITASRKSDNLITRMNMMQSELRSLGNAKPVGERKSFESLIATLSYQVGFEINDNITLARFNEYTKILKQREAANKDGRNK